MASQPPVPDSFVDNTGLSTVDGFVRKEVAGARRVRVCVGYVSEKGLARLADWLDLMDPDGELLLLVGMAPRHWKFLAKSAEAHAAYLLHSLQSKAWELDRALLQRLVAHQQAGRLQIRLRAPPHSVHAKLYLIQSGPNTWRGLAGSSNLSESGLTRTGEFNLVLDAHAAAQAARWLRRQWDAPSSQPAAGVWQALLDKPRPDPKAAPRPSGRAKVGRTRRSGCLKPVWGLLSLSALLMLLWSPPG